jgi:hypothetical protein
MRRNLWVWVRVLVSLGLVGYLIAQVDLGKLIATWRGVLLPLVALSFALQLGGVLISALKWWLLLRASGQPAPYWWAVRAYFIGQFFNNFLPTMIGGDAVRVYQLSQRSGRAANALASVFVERFLGFAALTSIAAVALSLSAPLLANAPQMLWGSTLCVLAAAGGLLVALAAPLLIRLLVRLRLPNVANWRGRLSSVARSLSAYYRYRGTLLIVALLSFGYQLAWIGANYAAARALHLQVSFAFMALMTPISDIVGLAPIFLNSLGAREGTFVIFFRQIGVGAELALALAWLIFILRLALSLLGGLLYLIGGLAGSRRSLSEEMQAVQRVRLAEKS